MANIPTKQDIERLKKQHGKIFEITVEPDEQGGEPVVFVFKKADRKTLSAVGAMYAKGDFMGASEVMAKNSLVWGDELLLNDDEILGSIAPRFEEINRVRRTEIKNL